MNNNKFSILLFLLFISLNSTAQLLSTHLYNYENTINPLFSKVNKKITITFDSNSYLDSIGNNFYVFKFDISDKKTELKGITNDINLTNTAVAINNGGLIGGLLSVGLSSSKQYSILNTNGVVFFNKKQFDSLVNFISKINELIKSNKTPVFYDKSYFFKIDKLELWLEVAKKTDYNDNTKTKSFYNDFTILFKIDNSVFIMDKDEIENFNNGCIKEIKEMWL